MLENILLFALAALVMWNHFTLRRVILPWGERTWTVRPLTAILLVSVIVLLPPDNERNGK